jgi:hypothetical protein
MAPVAIIHNHPAHYQHLLFCELAQKGLDFEVLFLAASSGARIQAPLPTDREYLYSIGHMGSYETAPRQKTSQFVRRSRIEWNVSLTTAICGARCLQVRYPVPPNLRWRSTASGSFRF